MLSPIGTTCFLWYAIKILIYSTPIYKVSKLLSIQGLLDIYCTELYCISTRKVIIFIIFLRKQILKYQFEIFNLKYTIAKLNISITWSVELKLLRTLQIQIQMLKSKTTIGINFTDKYDLFQFICCFVRIIMELTIFKIK